MKIQCSACEVAEAAVLCCADEAALCFHCDRNVHGANKLASKHERIPLANSSPMPNCDICQEMIGYFFCLDDRALMCRNCDIAVHTANPNVSSHQRFLLTGVRAGLDPSEPTPSSSMSVSSLSYENMMTGNSNAGNLTPTKRIAPVLLSSEEYAEAPPVQGGALGEDSVVVVDSAIGRLNGGC